MGKEPDNYIDLVELTHMDKEVLKKIFANIAILRKKLTGKGQSDIFF